MSVDRVNVKRKSMTLTCVILQSQESHTYERLYSVTFISPKGEIVILPRHAEAFFLIEKGMITLETRDGEQEEVPVERGECHVKDDMVKIFL